MVSQRAAIAQDATSAAVRRDLIAQAQTARTANDHARALELAERAAVISQSPSLRLFIAQEHHALGDFARALVEAEQCGRDADAETSARNRRAIANTCRALADANRARIAHLTVQGTDQLGASAVLLVSGRRIDRPLWGLSLPITPGNVDVVVSDERGEVFRTRTSVAPGASVQVRIEARAPVAPASSGTTASTNDHATTGAAATTDVSTASRRATPAAVTSNAADSTSTAGGEVRVSSRGTDRGGAVITAANSDSGAPSDGGPRGSAAPWVVLGSGGAMLVATPLLWVGREINLGSCVASVCANRATIDRVYGFTTASIVTAITGLIALPVGIVWAVAQPRGAGRRRAHGFSAIPTLSVDQVAIEMGGSF